MKKSLIYLAAAVFAVPAFNSCKKATTKKLSGQWNVASMSYSGSSEWSETDNGTGSSSTTDTWKSEESESFNGTEWSETSMSENSTTTGGSTSTSTTETEKGNGTYTTKTTSGGVTNTTDGEWSKKGSISYSIEKDNTFTKTTTYTEMMETVNTVTISGFGTYTTTEEEEVTVTETVSGTWSFLGESETEELKENDRVAFFYKSMTTTTETTGSDTEVFTPTSGTATTDTESFTSEEEEKLTYDDTDSDEIWYIEELGGGELSISGNMSYTSTGEWTQKETSGGTTTTTTGDSEGKSSGTFSAKLTEVE